VSRVVRRHELQILLHQLRCLLLHQL
jgi:hypothetical protein